MAAKTVRPGVFERYPQLATLKGLVPDDLVEREVGSRADEFERTLRRAAAVIPTVRLRDVFPPEIETGAIRLENFLGHWGNVSIETVCKICLIVRFLKPRRILEIGTYNGMTTLQMALNAPPECVIYTLDLPPDREPSIPPSELDRLVALSFRARFGTSTGSYFRGRGDLKVVQLLGDSATFDYGSRIDGPLDLVFIDGAHDYRSKAIDSENALRLLAPDGVIVWDNYADVCNPEVTRFLLDQNASLRLSHLRNTMLVVHRRTGHPENVP
jgi:predicted O-methyltransferase YrrM